MNNTPNKFTKEEAIEYLRYLGYTIYKTPIVYIPSSGNIYQTNNIPNENIIMCGDKYEDNK